MSDDFRGELGRELGITRQRVGQIEREAFAKLRLVVFTSDDYPLLREALGDQLPELVSRDIAAEWAHVEKARARRVVKDRD